MGIGLSGTLVKEVVGRGQEDGYGGFRGRIQPRRSQSGEVLTNTRGIGCYSILIPVDFDPIIDYSGRRRMNNFLFSLELRWNGET